MIIQKGWNVPSLKHLNLWEGVYEDAPKLRRCSLTERLNCLLFTVIDLENGEQFGDLQQVADSLGQVSQLDRTASIVGRGIQRHQSPEPAAVNEVHTTQIEHDVFIVRDQFFNRVTQAGGLLAENNATTTIDDQSTIYRSSTQS